MSTSKRSNSLRNSFVINCPLYTWINFKLSVTNYKLSIICYIVCGSIAVSKSKESVPCNTLRVCWLVRKAYETTDGWEHIILEECPIAFDVVPFSSFGQFDPFHRRRIRRLTNNLISDNLYIIYNLAAC